MRDGELDKSLVRKWLIGVFVVGLILRVLWVLLTESYTPVDGDSICRLSGTKGLIQGEFSVFHSVVWLPLHFIVLAIPSYLGAPLELGSRLFTAFLGAGFCVMGYFWNRQFLSQKSAVLAAFCFALWPQSLYLSSLTLSEIPFVLFLVGGILCLMRVRSSSQPLFWIYCSALVLTGANMIRFEGWLWSFVFAFSILVPSLGQNQAEKRGAWLRLALLWGILSVYPLYCMAISAWKNQGDPLFSSTLNALIRETEVQIAPWGGTLTQAFQDTWNLALVDSYNWYLFPLVIAIGVAVWRKLHWRLTIPIGLMFGIKLYSVLSGTLPPAPRYFFASLVLLWPMGFWLVSRLPGGRWLRLALAISLLLTGMHKGWQDLQIHRKGGFAGLRELVGHLGEIYTEGDVIYVDSVNWLHCHLDVMLPGVPQRNIRYIKDNGDVLLGTNDEEVLDQVEGRLSGFNLSWIVYADNAQLAQLSSDEFKAFVRRIGHKVIGRQSFGRLRLVKLERQ